MQYPNPMKFPTPFGIYIWLLQNFVSQNILDTFFFLDFFFFSESGDGLVVLSIDAMEGVLMEGGIDCMDTELDSKPGAWSGERRG